MGSAPKDLAIQLKRLTSMGSVISLTSEKCKVIRERITDCGVEGCQGNLPAEDVSAGLMDKQEFLQLGVQEGEELEQRRHSRQHCLQIGGILSIPSTHYIQKGYISWTEVAVNFQYVKTWYFLNFLCFILDHYNSRNDILSSSQNKT